MRRYTSSPRVLERQGGEGVTLVHSQTTKAASVDVGKYTELE